MVHGLNLGFLARARHVPLTPDHTALGIDLVRPCYLDNRVYSLSSGLSQKQLATCPTAAATFAVRGESLDCREMELC